MDAKRKTARLSILIAAGLVLGTVTTVCVLHQPDTDSESQAGTTQSVMTVQTEPAQPSQSPRNAAAAAQLPNDNKENGTSSAEYNQPIQKTDGKANPMAPIDPRQFHPFNRFERSSADAQEPAHVEARVYARSSKRHETTVPPPPDTPWFTPPPGASVDAARNALNNYHQFQPNGYSQPAPLARTRTKLTASDLHLVGLLDNRAIFAIPRDAVRELNLPSSVTLSPGQQFEGIKLVEVTKESATLRDSSDKLCTKELQSIR